MTSLLLKLWTDDTGNDLPEYAVAAAVFTAIFVVMKTLDIHSSDVLADLGIKSGSIVR